MECYVTDGSGLESIRRIGRADPGEPGPGEVRVDVRAVSLNYRDLMVADGRYGGTMDPAIVCASDMSGEVTAVGAGVRGFAPGDRVLNAPFRCYPDGRMRPEWIRTFVGGNGVDGVLGRHLIYPADALVPVPASCSWEEGSTLTIAGLTAWAAVVTHGAVVPGDWVLVHGTGGVSLFAAQIARAAGARVILTTSSSSKAETVRERIGVDHTLDYRDADWPEQLRTLTGGHGADIVVEVAGGSVLDQSLAACAYGARVGVIGVLSGGKSEITVRNLLSRQVTVRGIFMESTAELRAFARAVEVNGIVPWVDRVFGFDAVPDAYAHLAGGGHIGKVVIRVS